MNYVCHPTNIIKKINGFQDVLILSQFVRSDGCMLPRRITGLCNIQQKRITTMVAMAQKAGNLKRFLMKN